MYFSKFQVIFQNLHILPNIIFLEFWSIFPNHQFFPDSFTKIKWGPFLFLGLTGLKKNIFCIFLKLLIFFTFGVLFWIFSIFPSFVRKKVRTGFLGPFFRLWMDLFKFRLDWLGEHTLPSVSGCQLLWQLMLWSHLNFVRILCVLRQQVHWTWLILPTGLLGSR